MRRLSRHTVSSGHSTVVLDSSALACARGGLVSNFNRLTRASDYNPDAVKPDINAIPGVAAMRSGPTEGW
jgi:hypothetical protein